MSAKGMRLEVKFAADPCGTVVKIDGKEVENVQFIGVTQRAGELPVATIEVILDNGDIRISTLVFDGSAAP